MNNRTVIAADIAKNVFQCVQFKNNRQVGKNKAYKRKDFIKLITDSPSAVFVMESCSGAQHWARLAKKHHHEAILIAPRIVAGYRQGQKTDANDALAIYEASRAQHLKASPQKTLEQQNLSALDSVRNHYQSRKTRLNNAIRGLLAEFGIVMPKGYGSLRKQLPLILEDAENDIPDETRFALNLYWQDWQQAHEQVQQLDKQKLKVLGEIRHAKSLLKIEGIGPVCAARLICTLGDASVFKRGKDAAAFVGTSPKQHSSGGKEISIGISKKTGHKQLRSALIQGAWSVIIKLKAKASPSSEKERWLLQLIERVGENRAAVALANKNVRTAWALLVHEREYVAA